MADCRYLYPDINSHGSCLPALSICLEKFQCRLVLSDHYRNSNFSKFYISKSDLIKAKEEEPFVLSFWRDKYKEFFFYFKKLTQSLPIGARIKLAGPQGEILMVLKVDGVSYSTGTPEEVIMELIGLCPAHPF